MENTQRHGGRKTCVISGHFYDTMQGAPTPNRETGNKNEASHQCTSTSDSYNLDVGDKH